MSITTLRHYDDVGLLRPADVDPFAALLAEVIGRPVRVVERLDHEDGTPS